MLNHRQSRTCRAAVAACLLLCSVAPRDAEAAEAATVKIDNFAFVPDHLVVKAGTAVTFENDDDIPHLVAANDHSFKSKALDTNDTFVVTFAKPGDFAYFCGLHPHMQGKITVTP